MYMILEIIGTVAFAVSGAMAAAHRKMDILGVVTLALTTAIGGGIIRDVIMGITPPGALTNPLYAGIALVSTVPVFIPGIRKRINVDSMFFVIIDALGLGAFTVIGIEAASALNNVFPEIFLGVLTGVGGGVIRDIFSAEKPVIFVKRFYATASLAGAIVCAAHYGANKSAAMLFGVITVVVLRILAAGFKWNLPRLE